MSANNTIKIFELNEEIAKRLINEMLEIEIKAVEIIEVKTNTSRLFKEIEILFLIKKAQIFFLQIDN